jgi:hypothetical protein
MDRTCSKNGGRGMHVRYFVGNSEIKETTKKTKM